jgi:hypothetical protein
VETAPIHVGDQWQWRESREEPVIEEGGICVRRREGRESEKRVYLGKMGGDMARGFLLSILPSNGGDG